MSLRADLHRVNWLGLSIFGLACLAAVGALAGLITWSWRWCALAGVAFVAMLAVIVLAIIFSTEAE